MTIALNKSKLNLNNFSEIKTPMVNNEVVQENGTQI